MLRTFLGGLGGLSLLAVGLMLSSACFDVADTNYGNANGLARSNIPGEAGVIGAACTSFTVSIDGGGSCPSFANDIFPYFNGAWACTSAGCHGGPQAPQMNPASASETIAGMASYSIAGKPYLPTGTGGGDAGDPVTSSSFMCNVQGTCGSKMPKAPGIDLTGEEICLVQAWLRCGAPQ